MRRRLFTVLASTLTILALTASSALAHFCYNASRSDQGNMKAGSNSESFMTVDEFIDSLMLFVPGFCEEGADYLHDFAADAEISDALVHARVVMASGAEGKDIMSNGRGIDHLPESEFLEALAICGVTF